MFKNDVGTHVLPRPDLPLCVNVARDDIRKALPAFNARGLRLADEEDPNRGIFIDAEDDAPARGPKRGDALQGDPGGVLPLHEVPGGMAGWPRWVPVPLKVIEVPKRVMPPILAGRGRGVLHRLRHHRRRSTFPTPTERRRDAKGGGPPVHQAPINSPTLTKHH